MTLYTEKEAAEKWCPYGAEDSVTTASHIKRLTAPPQGRCIGSRCMAWQVAERGFKRERTDAEAEARMRSEFKDRVRIESRNWPSSGYDTIVIDARGYCGAFGKVE